MSLTSYCDPDIRAWPVVEASANHPDVKVSMTTKDGAIAYDFDYKGMVKTYKLVFEK